MAFVILAIITIFHTVTLLTGMNAMFYFHVLHPVMYLGLWLLLRIVRGSDIRPIYKGQHAVLMVGFGIAVYITLFVLLGIFFGFARNLMVPSMARGLTNLWTNAPFVLFSEMLRYRLIRDVKVNKNAIMISLVTVVFIFSQINSFPNMSMIFTVIAPVVILNVVLSYIAIDGTLPALILLRGVIVLVPILMPVWPNIPNDVWALFLHVILFSVLILYRMFMQEIERKRRELKEPLLKRFSPAIIFIAVLVLFNMGWFPIVPSVVLTESMAGTLERGSVALVRREFDEIGEGDVIQFDNGRNMLVIHRVIEIRSDFFGEPYFITKGDANDRPDTAPVRKEQITGVVFGSLRHIGMVRVWINQLFR